MMDNAHKDILQHWHVHLMDNLTYSEIGPYLIQKRIIGYDKDDEFRAEKGNRKQMNEFLCYLPRCGPDAFKKFAQIMTELDPPRRDIAQKLYSCDVIDGEHSRVERNLFDEAHPLESALPRHHFPPQQNPPALSTNATLSPGQTPCHTNTYSLGYTSDPNAHAMSNHACPSGEDHLSLHLVSRDFTQTSGPSSTSGPNFASSGGDHNPGANNNPAANNHPGAYPRATRDVRHACGPSSTTTTPVQAEQHKGDRGEPTPPSMMHGATHAMQNLAIHEPRDPATWIQNELTDEQQNKACTERLFARLCRSVSNVHLLGIELSFDRGEREQIQNQAPHSVMDQVLELLTRWRNRTRETEHTVKTLVSALNHAGVPLPSYSKTVLDFCAGKF